jgi:hypothetical protein
MQNHPGENDPRRHNQLFYDIGFCAQRQEPVNDTGDRRDESHVAEPSDVTRNLRRLHRTHFSTSSSHNITSTLFYFRDKRPLHT